MPIMPGVGVIKMSGDPTQAVMHNGLGYVLFTVTDDSNATMYANGDTVYVTEPDYIDEGLLDNTVALGASFLAREEDVFGELV